MTNMTTWQAFASGSGTAVTTWNYDANRGFLTSKKYNDGQGPSYTYTAAGRLYTRTWARSLTSTYTNNVFGDLYKITYSDSTPGIINSFDRQGRRTGVQDGVGTKLLAYDLAGRLLTETNTAGGQSGVGVAHAYDSLGRRTSTGLYSSSSLLASTSFGYDPASRLNAVTNGSAAVAYNYVDASPLLGQITFRQSGTTRMTTTKSYDYLNRLTRISSVPSASSVVSFDYAYNNANQRTTVTLGPDRSYWAYGYDSLGQVTSGKKYWYDGVPFAGQQFEYTFDDTCPVRYSNHVLLRICAAQLCRRLLIRGVYWRSEKANAGASRRRRTLDAESAAPGTCVLRDKPEPSGCDPPRAIPQERLGQTVPEEPVEALSHGVNNRKQTKAGGDASGPNLRVAWYTNTLLNQITNRTVPGSNDILGIAHASATVTVNGQSPYRRGEYYRKELALTNTASAVYAAVGNVAVLGTNTTTATGQLFLAKSPEAFTHDSDGNLTQDGRWNYMWDGENRLVRMLSLTNNTLTNSWLALNFTYDCQGRRISKTVSNYVAGAWQLKSDQRFVYDGWNLLAILSSDLSLQSSFTWGLDLSGSKQGAGGVGGLLGLNDASNGVFFVGYDGNGNVAALVNATNGTVSAQYEYGPFGELLRATGPIAKANPLRFSTKYQDDETDLIYYGYRYYNASNGKWPSRDPLGEESGGNLYAFLDNSPTHGVEVDGARKWPSGKPVTVGDGDSIVVVNVLTMDQAFDNPPSLGKRCCCEPFGFYRMTGQDNQSSKPYFRAKIRLKAYPCVKELAIRWTTCNRGGRCWLLTGFNDSLTSEFKWNGPGCTYTLVARIRYLSCIGGFWQVRYAETGFMCEDEPGLFWNNFHCH